MNDFDNKRYDSKDRMRFKSCIALIEMLQAYRIISVDEAWGMFFHFDAFLKRMNCDAVKHDVSWK